MELGCQVKVSTFAQLLIILDIFRAALFTPIFVGIFCGTSHVFLHKKGDAYIGPEIKNVRVDYLRNREIMIYCMLIGMLICCVDLLMGISLDNIMRKRLRVAGVVWTIFATIGLILRNYFNYYVWVNEEWLGLHRLGVDMTQTTELVLRPIFMSMVLYEGVKGVQLLLAIFAQCEVQRPMSSRIHAEQNFPRY